MKKLNKNSIIQLIGILLILSSVVYIGYYKARVTQRKNNIEQSKEQFINESKNKVLVDNLIGSDDVKNDSKSNVDTNKEKSNAVAFLEVNKLGILLPVFEGTSNKELRDGVGLVEGTDYPSDELPTG